MVRVELDGGVSTAMLSARGTILPRIRETQAATKETEIAWTCSNVQFPSSMARMTLGSSSSPILAAVESRAERFISRFPWRLRTVGMIIINWSTCSIASQRCASVGERCRAVRMGTYRDAV
jgi:hypothetical protein